MELLYDTIIVFEHIFWFGVRAVGLLWSLGIARGLGARVARAWWGPLQLYCGVGILRPPLLDRTQIFGVQPAAVFCEERCELEVCERSRIAESNAWHLRHY